MTEESYATLSWNQPPVKFKAERRFRGWFFGLRERVLVFIQINEENNIKKGNNSKREYFNSIFTQDDMNDFSEFSQDLILNINP